MKGGVSHARTGYGFRAQGRWRAERKKAHRLGIMTVEDLLTHYPREYKDRSEILKIADLPPDEPATFLAADKGGGAEQPPRQACVYQNEGLRRNRRGWGAVV